MVYKINLISLVSDVLYLFQTYFQRVFAFSGIFLRVKSHPFMLKDYFLSSFVQLKLISIDNIALKNPTVFHVILFSTCGKCAKKSSRFFVIFFFRKVSCRIQ